MPAGFLVGVNTYTTTGAQTVVIPKGATKARIRLQAGGGSAKSTATTDGVAAAGAGGYLEKFLTGLAPGLTLLLTVGAGGSATPGNGAASTLASGSQTIATLTCNGGALANSATFALGAGGTATGGDLNITGGSGTGGQDNADASSISTGGSCPLGFGPTIVHVNALNGNNYGSGGCSGGNNQVGLGAQGVCIIEWFS